MGEKAKGGKKNRKMGRNKLKCAAYRAREPQILKEREKRHARHMAKLAAYGMRRAERDAAATKQAA